MKSWEEKCSNAVSHVSASSARWQREAEGGVETVGSHLHLPLERRFRSGLCSSQACPPGALACLGVACKQRLHAPEQHPASFLFLPLGFLFSWLCCVAPRVRVGGSSLPDQGWNPGHQETHQVQTTAPRGRPPAVSPEGRDWSGFDQMN